jgi:single-strand DNA-binding protein
VWNEPLQKVIKSYCKKGSKIYIQGQLETRKWQDQSGNDRYTTEVVLRPFNSTVILLDRKDDSGGQRGGGDYDQSGPDDDGDQSQSYGFGGTGGGGQSARPRQRPQPAAFDTDLDDDVPF